MDRRIDKILKSIDKLSVDPDELSDWMTSIEITARHMCNDKDGDKIIFQYSPDEKLTRFFFKDSECRDCLVKSIEIHLPLIPEMLKGFFSVLKYNLKYAKFETETGTVLES
jgi:hypothetical protein